MKRLAGFALALALLVPASATAQTELPVGEAHGACPPEAAARRSAERVATTQPVHALRALAPEDLAQYDRPLGSGPVSTVDTRRSVDPPGIAARVRRAFDAEMT